MRSRRHTRPAARSGSQRSPSHETQHSSGNPSFTLRCPRPISFAISAQERGGGRVDPCEILLSPIPVICCPLFCDFFLDRETASIPLFPGRGRSALNRPTPRLRTPDRATREKGQGSFPMPRGRGGGAGTTNEGPAEHRRPSALLACGSGCAGDRSRMAPSYLRPAFGSSRALRMRLDGRSDDLRRIR
jgi:hypothetical protein